MDTYEKKLALAKEALESGSYDKETIEYIFPELAESDDERIIKSMTRLVKAFHNCNFPTPEGFERKDMLAWLEKQVSQDDAEDVDILHRFSFYSYKDEPNVLYLSGLYVNEEYRNKGIGTKILEVADEVAKSLDCHAIRLKTKKDSDAERLYRTHGYNSLATEDKDEIWLEKQGEKIENANKEYWRGYREGKKEILDKYAEFEKQGEKPYVELKFKVGDLIKLSKEPKYPAREIISIKNDGYYFDSAVYLPFERQDDWELVDTIQNPTWNEEDEDMLKRVIKSCEQCGNEYAYYWLKSLKDRVQPKPKQGWNKEDEYNYEIVMYCLNNQCVGAKDKENAMSWFKSFKDRVGCEVNCTTTKEWKPSERQISALEWQLKNTSEGSWQYIETEKLLERLKNL